MIKSTGGSMAKHQKSDKCRRGAEAGVAGPTPAGKRSGNRGSGTRSRYTWRRKHRVVWDLKHRQELGLGGYGSFLTDDVAMDHNVPASNLRRWVGAWGTISKNAADSKLKNKERVGKATYKCGDVDKAVMDRFDKLRSDGRAITPRWLVHEYKLQMLALHPDRAHHWKASPR